MLPVKAVSWQIVLSSSAGSGSEPMAPVDAAFPTGGSSLPPPSPESDGKLGR